MLNHYYCTLLYNNNGYICVLFNQLKTKKMVLIKSNGNKLLLHYAHASNSGHGHKRIFVDFYYKGLRQSFNCATSNMPDYDDAMELENDEKYLALYYIIHNQIEEQILEWIYKIDNLNLI